MWFWFALLCLLFWGGADLFYKKGTDADDRYSHLKIAVWVGLVMGAGALILLPFSEFTSLSGMAADAVKYTPASLSYIISMVIGYAGLRYLEVSIVSPVQNASGAFSMIAMLIFFAATGTVNEDLGDLSAGNLVGTGLIAVGLVALAVTENRLARKEADALAGSAEEKKRNRKYQFGALALLFPILYCIFDTVGTAADGIILNEETGLGLGEIEVLILYGLTFLLAGIGAWIFLLIKTKKPYNPFAKKEMLNKGAAALFEEGGQIFYVYAMAKNPVLAAPMVASYCIVSVILSRIFLKEKLKASQYACVAAVIAGIVILGVMEGLGEME
ncbi:MAG: EamA family transporter [Clostridia bacterium]|nr:EamA family transporter [Clostridia bacterium]